MTIIFVISDLIIVVLVGIKNIMSTSLDTSVLYY